MVNDDARYEVLDAAIQQFGGESADLTPGQQEIVTALSTGQENFVKVAMRGDKVLGAIAWRKELNENRNLVIEHLGSTGELKGTGSSLVQAATNAASIQGAGMEFEATEEAVTFYDKLGFKRDEEVSLSVGAKFKTDAKTVDKILRRLKDKPKSKKSFAKVRYSEDQPRDELGRFGESGGDAQEKLAALPQELDPVSGVNSVPSSALFSKPVLAMTPSLNPKKVFNVKNVNVAIDELHPAQEYVTVAGLKAYIDAPRKDPVDVVNLIAKDGTSRQVLAEGHTRTGAAKLRGETTILATIWHYAENDRGVYAPVPPKKKKSVGYRYSEDQPRDELGRFGEGGGGDVKWKQVGSVAEREKLIKDFVSANESASNSENYNEIIQALDADRYEPDSPSHNVSIREVNGKIVGAVAWEKEPNDNGNINLKHLGSLQKGVGTSLVEEVLSDAAGTYGVELDSLPGANGFYEKLGFKEDSSVPPSHAGGKYYVADIDQVLEILDGIAAKQSKGKALVNKSAHDFSTTQFNLPESQRWSFDWLVEQIDVKDIVELENEPHVTVKYGLHTNRVDDVRKVVIGFGAVKLRFGDCAYFEGEEYDVVYVAVESKELRQLNALLSSELEHTTTHDAYTPHMTIAYVVKGTGKAYASLQMMGGVEAIMTRLTFSDVNGRKTEIRL